MIEDLGLLILTFNIYNPDKHIITDFTKNELPIYRNLMFLINNLRNFLQVLITFTLFLVIIQQTTAILTIRFLLNEKKYSNNENNNKYKSISQNYKSESQLSTILDTSLQILNLCYTIYIGRLIFHFISTCVLFKMYIFL